MPCYASINAWQSKRLNPLSGKRYITFKPCNGSELIQLPCGRCIGCRLERSRQWAIRCIHEQTLHDESCFITLTFDEENVDYKKSLIKKDFQKFMKRLRKRYKGRKIRFLHAGEYGEKNQRPHHHAILFGIDFEDKQFHNVRNKCTVYKSEILKKLWPFGLSEIGEATFESMAYVARYCCKKQSDKQIYKTNSKLLNDGRVKEYNTMSRNPGLASGWLDKYGESSVWNTDSIVIRGKEMKPPSFYTKKYELTNPDEFVILKLKRKQDAADNEDNKPERLQVRERIQMERFKKLQRSI